MTYKFTLYYNDDEGFMREYKLDAEATFFDFHKIIQKSCGYNDLYPTSFFICEDTWEMKQEVTLEDMRGDADEDNYVMDTTTLEELIDDEGQRLMYIFDPLAERAFFIELSAIESGNQPQPQCTLMHGMPPQQDTDLDAFTDNILKQDTTSTFDEDDDEYGFNEEEIDPNGFDITDGDPYQ